MEDDDVSTKLIIVFIIELGILEVFSSEFDTGLISYSYELQKIM